MKIFKSLGVSLLVIFVVFGTYSPMVSAEKKVKDSIGKAYTKLVADMGKELNEEEKAQLTEAGWEFNGENWEITRKVQSGQLVVNGERTTVEDGTFVVKGAPSVIEVIVQGETKLIERNSDGEYILVHEENWNELMDRMDSMDMEGMDHDVHAQGYGDKYSYGDWVHCNRFNGVFTDDVHYSKSADPVGAARNFVGSDCDVAFLSWLKCYSHDYCNIDGPAAACSDEIGHKSFYHSHN